MDGRPPPSAIRRATGPPAGDGVEPVGHIGHRVPRMVRVLGVALRERCMSEAGGAGTSHQTLSRPSSGAL
eukprot:4870501-Prymnesium_polylepis.1